MTYRLIVSALALLFGTYLLDYPSVDAQEASDLVDEYRQRLEVVEGQADALAGSSEANKREKLEALIRNAFEAKQAMHRAQIQLLQERVSLLQADIGRREALAEKIIKTRVDELLAESESPFDPLGGHQPETSETQEHGEPSIIKVFYLRYLEAEQAHKSLQRFLDSDTNVVMDHSVNALLIRGTEEELNIVAELVSLIDRPTDEIQESQNQDASTKKANLEEGAVDSVAGGEQLTLEKQLAELEAEEKWALTRFGAKHPRVLVMSDRIAQVKLELAKSTDGPFLVAIPTEAERKRQIADLEKQMLTLQQVKSRVESVYTEQHPRVQGVLHKIDHAESQLKDLRADLVRYKIYLGVVSGNELRKYLSQIPRIESVMTRVSPRGYFELAGPRKAVVEMGDELVELMNAPKTSPRGR